MNNAIFIRGGAERLPTTFQKIYDAQNEISDALRELQASVGEIEISEESSTAKLVINEELLKQCHNRIVDNADLIRSCYEELIEKGLFEKWTG